MVNHTLLLQNFLLPGGEIDTQRLKDLAKEHPYFPISGFYLLRDAELNKKQAEHEAKTASLHFTNRRWLDFQLHHPIDILVSTELKGEDGENETIEQLVPIEPYHTIDYFASQGIKLSRDINMNDKLGKQMRSFTEWLKTMKKIPGEKLQAASEQSDRNIQTIAEASNSASEIVTEAMAEVLEKQGKLEKAIETYTKLSLLYPSKSAYFAAKIDTLNRP